MGGHWAYIIGEQVTLNGLMQGCNEGEAMKLKGKQVDLSEEGGSGKCIDGKIGRTTTYAAHRIYRFHLIVIGDC